MAVVVDRDAHRERLRNIAITRPKRHLHLDFETASECDLRKRGLMNYAKHASTRVLMLGWAFDDEPVQLWEPHLQSEMPARLRAALADPSVVKVAHNAQFERAILEDVLKIDTPVEQWRCTMIMAYMLALPGSLKELGQVIRLPEEQQKAKTGATLIRRFCIPREPTEKKPWRWATPYNEPEDWRLFCEYCVQDVATERVIFKKLSKFYVPDFEWELWQYDQEINRRGVPVDLDFVRAALDVAMAEKKRLTGEMKKITALANPSSTAQLLPWLRPRGYPFSDMRKERVAKALEDFDRWDQRPPKPAEPDLDPRGRTADERAEIRDRYEKALARHANFHPLSEEAKVVLRLHQQASRTSWKKYQAILDQEYEGRLYYQYQFAGAGRTNRWAGRGVQLQNFPRPAKAHIVEINKQELLDPFLRQLIANRDLDGLRIFYGDVMSCLASALRSAITAPEGYTFVVSDLSSIESRVIGWVANCQTLLDVFRQGKCAYRSFATFMFNKAYDEISKTERNLAKAPVLGCGFMLSGGDEVGTYPDTSKTGLFGYAAAMHVDMTREQAHEAVRIFRTTYVEITELWNALQTAAFEAVRTQQPQHVGLIQFDIKAPFLRIRLPSGRFLWYLRPKLELRKVKLPSGEVRERLNLTYEGYDRTRQWTRIPTHPGKLVENIVQAAARDVLAHGMFEARKAGFSICASTHDELICEQEDLSGLRHEDLSRCMSVVPPWAKGLPLDAQGYVDRTYRK